MLVAGEPSGDQHGAALARELTRRILGCRLSGMGMSSMRKTGVQIVEDSSDISVTGIMEVLRYYPRIKAKFKSLCRHLQQERPDLLVLIDYPEFNLKLAKFAHQLKIKTLFYISPQVWAWRSHRVHKIARIVDVMVVIFPFEIDYYKDTGLEVHCIDHPLLDEVRHAGVVVPREIAAPSMKTNPIQRILLLPGSRISEIKRLLPVLCQSAKRLLQENSQLQFSLLLAPGVDAHWIQKVVKQYELPCQYATHNYTAMQQTDFAITASGTASLQLTLCAIPMIVIYKTSWITYFIVKCLLKTRYIALPNILSGRRIVKEFVQKKANPKTIARTVMHYLNHSDEIFVMQQHLIEVSSQLGQGQSSQKLAGIIEKSIKERIRQASP